MNSRCRICGEPKFGPHPYMCIECESQDQWLKDWYRAENVKARKERRKRMLTNLAVYAIAVVAFYLVERFWILGGR